LLQTPEARSTRFQTAAPNCPEGRRAPFPIVPIDSIQKTPIENKKAPLPFGKRRFSGHLF